MSQTEALREEASWMRMSLANKDAEIARLRADLKAQKGDYGYAVRLLQAICEKHYGRAVVPLETLSGVLTQIDNATCGLVRAPSHDGGKQPK